jgi:hypothetical protein
MGYLELQFVPVLGTVAFAELLLPFGILDGGCFFLWSVSLRGGFGGDFLSMMMIVMGAVLIMDMSFSPGRVGNLDEGQLKFGKNTREDLLLILGEVTTCLLMDDLEMIDEHLGRGEIHLGLPRGGMGDLSEAKGCLLGIHHDEFDEALGEIGRVGCLLDFSHMGWWLKVEVES